MGKAKGYLISAFYFGEQRPITFHIFDTEAEKCLGDLQDAKDLATGSPEYMDILKDFDPELSSIVELEMLEYKLEVLDYE